MARYLLGHLPEDELLELEASFFADDDAYESLLALEDELVEAYAAGRLEGDDKVAFETRYLASERGRRRVATTRAIIRFAKAAPDTARTGVVSIADVLRERRTPRTVLTLAIAASLAIAAGGVYWLATRDAGKTGPIARTDEPQSEPGSGTPPVLAPPDAGNTIPPEHQTNPPRREVVSVTLETPEFRGDETERSVKMPEDADSLRLTLVFVAEAYRRYRVVVSEPNGRAIWRRDGLAAAPGERRRLALSIPAARLGPGRYVVTVSGRTENGGYEAVADYAIRVTR